MPLSSQRSELMQQSRLCPQQVPGHRPLSRQLRSNAISMLCAISLLRHRSNPISMLYAISLLSPSRQLRSAARALGRGATATWAKGLLLFRFFPRVAGEYVFADRAALLTARDAWCANPTGAAETFGAIEKWNVAAVTSMVKLFCASSNTGDCNKDCTTFDADL